MYIFEDVSGFEQCRRGRAQSNDKRSLPAFSAFQGEQMMGPRFQLLADRVGSSQWANSVPPEANVSYDEALLGTSSLLREHSRPFGVDNHE